MTIKPFMDALSRRTQGDVRSDLISRTLYSTDASIYQITPHGVLIPKHEEDIHAAVELAAQHKIPILPRGGGSSLAGQCVNEALVIDTTKHLNQIIELNTEERWVRVQPGMNLDALNRALRPHKLQFGPDPASANRAVMGGIISNNSTGSHSIMYGMAADHVLGLSVYLSDGSKAEFEGLDAKALAVKQKSSGLEGDIYRRINAMVWDQSNQAIITAGTPKHWRRCGGYNIDRLLPPTVDGLNFHPLLKRDESFNVAKLFSGAEGTLGVIAELKLNLVPIPEMTGLAVLHFSDPIAALETVPTILECTPSAIEMVDKLALTACKDVPEYDRWLNTFIDGEPNCILITEFYGTSHAELTHKIDHLQSHLTTRARALTSIVPVYDEMIKKNVWSVRKAGLGLLMGIRSDYKPIPIIEDSAVPPENLAEYVEHIETFCNELNTDVIYYAHASAGCLHIRPLINTKLQTEVNKMPRINEMARALIKQYGGAYSSEHGDGLARSWANEAFYGRPLYELYCEIKSIFDPHNLMNPGNIVNAAPMTENLRYGDSYHVKFVRTALDFSDDHGFDRAIEMCNGQGICRKTVSGTMCPSYMATGEEMHSTRGRANLLRSALSGQLPKSAFTGPELKEAMDLCLSCKACKSECSTSVDMAKIKAEWTYQYNEQHGIPLRSRLFAHIDLISRSLSGPWAPIVNWGARLGPVRKLTERIIGIGGDKRPLPAFAFTPFTRWFAQRPKVSRAKAGQVVLFNDTYNTYNDPRPAKAAVEVLEAAGFEVLLAGVTDTGRPAISKGLLDLAKRIAGHTLDHLEPYADRGLSIIFLEPSELSAITDDYKSLLPDDRSRIDKIAAQSVSFEQFITGLAKSNQLDLAFKSAERAVLLHGHCHQKALIGTKPSHELLHLVPNTTVNEVDSGCCGMAGSFGYESEKIETSFKVGERRLLPAVRDASKEAFVVAAGISCRQQIFDGAKRRAIHPAEFLAKALK